MTYAVQQDIEDRYPGALKTTGPRTEDGELDTAAITKALEYADGRIKEELGELASRYIAPYPAWLVDLAVDLALYRSTPAALIETFADYRTRHDAAITRLRRIGAGEIKPPTPPTVPAATSGVTISSQPRRFTRPGMKKLL